MPDQTHTPNCPRAISRKQSLTYFGFCLWLLFSSSSLAEELKVEAPRVALVSIPIDVSVAEAGELDVSRLGELVLVGGRDIISGVVQEDGRVVFEGVVFSSGGRAKLELKLDGEPLLQHSLNVIPAWASLLPPFVAILLALVFRSVIPSLFAGIWVGAWAVTGFSLYGLWSGLLATMENYVHRAVADTDHAAIMIFTFMVGGMVGLISRNGGMQGVVNLVVRWSNTARRTQIATWGLGLLIFFDDYANTLVVGNTARPLNDRMRISREKLAYIVDSTAAPVATVALVTTWIGYQVGLIGDGIAQINGIEQSAYAIFLNSIPYSFYPLLCIVFVLAVATTGRDFGPMYHAEVRARTTGVLIRPDAEVDDAAISGKELAPGEDTPLRAVNALLPVGVLIAGVLGGLWVTGEGDGFQQIIASADSYRALMWASLLAVLTAALLSLGQGILTLSGTVDAWYAGVKFMLFAMIILVLAWALSSVTDVLHTADYLVALLGDTLAPQMVPATVFVLAALVAFATGTSWGVMAILMPLSIPLTWGILEANDLVGAGEHMHIFYSTIACVLAGAVWGDHCSPISDTTVLSSLASGCDHIDHVRTQMPYALLVGSAGLLLGTVPAGYGLPWWLSYAIAIPLLLGILHWGGKRADDAPAAPAGPDT